MSTKTESAIVPPDSAAVFACALSLWQAGQKRANQDHLDISECYNGMDQFMREVMRVANQFEAWACLHVNFDEVNDVWPYFLEDRFGEACLAVLLPSALSNFDESFCLLVALRLRLPVMVDDALPIPINLNARNPVFQSAFRELRIQTVRRRNEDGEPTPYCCGDDPFDEEFGSPFFGLYGVAGDGILDHIADRGTYAEVLALVQKLAPGVNFPSVPTFAASQ
jgi:hypothetical protein